MDYCKIGEGVAKAAFVGTEPAPKRGKGSKSQPINESKCKEQEELTEKTTQNKADLKQYCKELTDSYYCCPKNDGCGFGKTKKKANLPNLVLLSRYCEPFDRNKPVQEYYCCPNDEKLSECDSSVTCAVTLGELNALNPYDVLTAFPCRHHFKTEGFQSSDLTTITNPFDKLEKKTTCPLCRYPVKYYYTGPLLSRIPHTLDDGLLGIQWNKKGEKYEGTFKMGSKMRGTTKYPNGDVYEGEYENDKKNGQGMYRWSDGNVYNGEWKDDNRNGQGMYTWTDGNVYEGGFKDGDLHGQGTLKFPNGEALTGEWKDGEANGQGKYTWPNGRAYEGEFKDSKFYGQGTMKYSNGRVYTGGWDNNLRNGKGKLKFSNGDVYFGKWKDDERQDKGVYRFADGLFESREYENGELLTRTFLFNTKK